MTEVGQIGQQGVVAHFYAVTIGYCLGVASEGDHAVDTDFIVSLIKCSSHLTGLLGGSGGALFGRGAAADQYGQRTRYNQNITEFLHIVEKFKSPDGSVEAL